MHKLMIIVGAVLLLFGLACFNYTKASAWDHHMAFARQNQLPEPSSGILFCGIVAVSFGAGMIGYSSGARKRPGVALPASAQPSSESG
jgi:hypothetical protein